MKCSGVLISCCSVLNCTLSHVEDGYFIEIDWSGQPSSSRNSLLENILELSSFPMKPATCKALFFAVPSAFAWPGLLVTVAVTKTEKIKHRHIGTLKSMGLSVTLIY